MPFLPNLTPAGASAIQGGAGLLGSIANNIFARRRQKKQFAHDREQAAYAYDRDVDMWNRQSDWNLSMWNLQNQYNLPSAHMERLRQAGLNPNLIAGSSGGVGQATAVQPATMPKYQQVRPQYSHPGVETPNVLGMYNSFRMANAQTDNLKSVTDLNEQRATTEAIKQHGMGYDNAIKYANAKYSMQMMQLERDRRLQALENLRLDRDIKSSISGLRQMDVEWMRDYGMRAQDPVWYRWMIRLWRELESRRSR